MKRYPALIYDRAITTRTQDMTDPTISIARKAYQAYIDKDRAAIEALFGDDFRFTSPLDTPLNRQPFFERCGKNSETLTDFTFINLVGDGERVFVTYEGQSATGKRF